MATKLSHNFLSLQTIKAESKKYGRSITYKGSHARAVVEETLEQFNNYLRNKYHYHGKTPQSKK